MTPQQVALAFSEHVAVDAEKQGLRCGPDDIKRFEQMVRDKTFSTDRAYSIFQLQALVSCFLNTLPPKQS